jgi:hypothetical protein
MRHKQLTRSAIACNYLQIPLSFKTLCLFTCGRLTVLFGSHQWVGHMSQKFTSRRGFWRRDGKLIRLALAASCLFIATPALGQSTEARSGTVAPVGSMPPGVVMRPETAAKGLAETPVRSAPPANGPEPLSERAAAAAARASRALATEDGSDFGPEDVKQIELVDNVDASPKLRPNGVPTENVRPGAGIVATERAKTSAVKPMTTCVAGCY